MTETKLHRLEVETDVLDQIVKSIMQSVTANTQKRRRLNPSSSQGRTAQHESELLNRGLQAALRAQTESW